MAAECLLRRQGLTPDLLLLSRTSAAFLPSRSSAVSMLRCSDGRASFPFGNPDAVRDLEVAGPKRPKPLQSFGFHSRVLAVLDRVARSIARSTSRSR
eukprot:6115702-Heterocapsa_arctica.AAC.1